MSTHRRRGANLAVITVMIVGAAGFSTVAGGSTNTKRASFCAAEGYLAHHVEAGSVLPDATTGWTTIAREKATLTTLDDEIALTEADAPTPSFARLDESLVGLFNAWINDPTLLAQHLVTASGAPAFKGTDSLPAGFLVRVTTAEDVQLSGDYVWTVYAVCPSLRRGVNPASKSAAPYSPPTYLATPTDVLALNEARWAVAASTYMPPRPHPTTLASLKYGVAYQDARYPSYDISLVGAPTLSHGSWRAEYRDEANGKNFDIYFSLPDSSASPELAVGGQATNVVAVSS